MPSNAGKAGAISAAGTEVPALHIHGAAGTEVPALHICGVFQLHASKPFDPIELARTVQRLSGTPVNDA